jgi:hypothetical protein
VQKCENDDLKFKCDDNKKVKWNKHPKWNKKWRHNNWKNKCQTSIPKRYVKHVNTYSKSY